jgi:hypothetical protein
MSFALICVVLYILTRQDVVSFSFLWTWSALQQIRIDRGYSMPPAIDAIGDPNNAPNTNELLVMGWVLAQIKLSQWNIYRWDLLSQWVRRLVSSDSLLSVDIYALLEWVENRRKTLSVYIQRLQAEIHEHQIIYEKIFYDGQELLHDARVCLQDKMNADSKVVTSVANRYIFDLQASIHEATDAADCYAQKRVQWLAYDYLAQHLSLHLQLLKRRLLILEQNEEMIIAYFPLLEGNLLNQLNDLKRQLEAVRTISPQQLNSFFNRGISQDMWTPQLLNIWFRNVQPPNYILPWMP